MSERIGVIGCLVWGALALSACGPRREHAPPARSAPPPRAEPQDAPAPDPRPDPDETVEESASPAAEVAGDPADETMDAEHESDVVERNAPEQESRARDPAAPRQCASEAWGGWPGTPACRRAARQRIAGAHRRCDRDADCTLVGTGCDPHGVSARVAARYRRTMPPCASPGGGACAGPRGAVCDSGCCEPDYFHTGTGSP